MPTLFTERKKEQITSSSPANHNERLKNEDCHHRPTRDPAVAGLGVVYTFSFTFHCPALTTTRSRTHTLTMYVSFTVPFKIVKAH